MFKRALIAAPIVGIGIAALAACSPATTPAAAPSTTTAPVLTTTAASAAAPTTTSAAPATNATPAGDNGCKANPATAAVPTADPYEWVPKADEVQVSLSKAPAAVTVGGAPVEVDVTVCNNSPVAYPKVGFVFALDHCSCAHGPVPMAKGVVQRYDNGQWVTMQNASTGTGMDYLGLSNNQQPLPKGKAVTVRYRFSYDPSMTSGQGGVLGAVVTPDGPHVLGQAKVSYTVNH